MLIDTEFLENGLAVMKLTGRLVRTSALLNLSEMIVKLQGQGRRGLLLDLSKVHKINMAGTAALVELVARNPKADLALCAVPRNTLEFLRKSGLDRGLQIFPSVQDACQHPDFRAHTLVGTPAVILCAGKGSRVAPLTEVSPKPMLDVAGRSTLHRIIDHMASFGLRDVLLNPGHLGHEIIDYFRANAQPDLRITYVNEGHWRDGDWQSAPIGSASTLKRMQDQNAAFDSDFIVLCGDALIDIDLSEMMREHKASGADATIAALTVPESEVHKYGIIEATSTQTVTRFVEKPEPGVTDSRLANSGIYIFKPSVLELLSNEEGLDIACDLLPSIMTSVGKIHVYNSPFAWVDIGCGRDYARAVGKCLAGETPFAAPLGQEIRPGVWAMPNAYVSPRAEITGPCHIGAHARVEAGAKLTGTCSIGAGATIEGKTLLRDCIVMPETCVEQGTWAQDMIVHPQWAVDHTRADGSPQERGALKGISSTKSAKLAKTLQIENEQQTLPKKIA